MLFPRFEHLIFVIFKLHEILMNRIMITILCNDWDDSISLERCCVIGIQRLTTDFADFERKNPQNICDPFTRATKMKYPLFLTRVFFDLFTREI